MGTETPTSPRVLVVEDEVPIRTILVRMLEDSGYTVHAAADGVEGLEHLQQQPCDLILLDVWMPRMNGLEFLTQLQQRPKPLPRVIIMTGDHTPETLLQAIQQNAYQYVSKPFSAEAVVELVGKALAAPASAPAIEVLSAKPDWVELQVPCQREAVERIQSFLMGMKSYLEDEVRESIGLAFHELLLNAIEWGGRFDPSAKVRIAFLRARGMVLYRIADPGTGFRFQGLTHAAITNPADSSVEHMRIREEKGLRPGGFGILLASSVVDELIYNQSQNEVVFVKYLH
jgi:CheY-like chemotaxis protein/anti-sigma regulatory factor (Ser/Thr protein kinase)